MQECMRQAGLAWQRKKGNKGNGGGMWCSALLKVRIADETVALRVAPVVNVFAYADEAAVLAFLRQAWRQRTVLGQLRHLALRLRGRLDRLR